MSSTSIKHLAITLLALGVGACNNGFKLDKLQPETEKQRGENAAPPPSTTKDLEGCQIPAGAGSVNSLHRLNATEFDNSIRSLLQNTSKAFGKDFPAENADSGFDNGAKSLVTNATLVEKYWSAAEALGQAVVQKYPEAACLNSKSANCLNTRLDQLGSAIFRRPLFNDEKTRLLGLPGAMLQQGATLSEAYSSTAMALLLSPQFLFRAELPGNEIANQEHYIRAERLSYFLWSAPPDAALLALAAAGKLSDPAIVKAQVERMLADPKADALVKNFASQWLGTRNLVRTSQNNGSSALAEAFEGETMAFINEFVRTNLNVRRLLDAKFSYLNSQLVSHYGLRNVNVGATMQRVDLSTTPQRGGLLSQGAFLVQTSNPSTTSPVKRGKWVLENLLCSPPSPPPSDEALVFAAIDQNLPMRARMAKHRENPACAGCHVQMDPIGLGFENYDAAGKWRTSDRNQVIDATGNLPDGSTFANVTELSALLQNNPLFPKCVTQKLSTYALGREPSAAEMCIVNRLAEKSASDSYGLRDLIIDIAVNLVVR